KYNNSQNNKAGNGDQDRSFWDKAARPPYYTDALVQADVEELTKQLASNQGVRSPSRALDADVELLRNRNAPQQAIELPLITQMSAEQANALRIRVVDPQFLLEKAQDAPHIINGMHFDLYRVSGHDFRCFFNSMGLNAEHQVNVLLNNRDNLLIRAIIANEI